MLLVIGIMYFFIMIFGFDKVIFDQVVFDQRSPSTNHFWSNLSLESYFWSSGGFRWRLFRSVVPFRLIYPTCHGKKKSSCWKSSQVSKTYFNFNEIASFTQSGKRYFTFFWIKNWVQKRFLTEALNAEQI